MAEAQAINTLSFEDALGELENIVKALETGQAPLENSIAAYERGMALKQHCEEKLRDAQAKIEKITVSNDDSLATTPLDPDNSTNNQ